MFHPYSTLCKYQSSARALQPCLFQTTIQFIFKYSASFSRLFLAWWSSDDVLASDWSAWPHEALWLADGHWPPMLLITGSDVGLVCPRGCKVGPDQLQLGIRSIDMSAVTKTGQGPFSGRWSTVPMCRQMWRREWYEYDDQSRCAVFRAALGTNFMKSRQQWQRHSSPHWQAVKILY